MANLTKEKRDKMISFIESLKNTYHNDDSAIIALNELKNNIIDKKFGVVFERHTEDVDNKIKENIPVFNENKERCIKGDKNLPWNFIIEGDNLQSLYLLEKTHKGKIDCIYIDPPYNTGAKDWKYNNDYVVKEDSYRHSKWLSMMSTRLSSARHLLTNTGVLICAIDENELATLRLLIDDVFGEDYHTDIVCIVHNPRGVQGDNFSYTNEYALFVYRKGSNPICEKHIEEEEVEWSPLRNWGSESLREDAATCFYAIKVKDEKIIGFGENKTDDIDFHPNKNEIDAEGIISVYPIDVNGIERKWRYNRESVEKIKNLLRVKNDNGIYDIELGKNFGTYKTVWTDKKYDANEYGTQLINSMVPNNDFTFPKSLYNVYECLYAATFNKPNAIILDFFAGSGTTGHATFLMNKINGGNRKCILCTNNAVGEKKEKEFKEKYNVEEIDCDSMDWKEWQERYGIASSVTYPRMKAVIEGFVHKKDFKTILYSKKMSATVLKRIDRVKEEIEVIKIREENNYDIIELDFDNNYINLLGIKKKGERIDGIIGNLKYFKCDWTPRKPEEYLLSNALCLHIKEMIELQNSIEIDNFKNVLILSKEDYNKYIKDNKKYENIEKIWVNQNIVFDGKEMKLLKDKNFKYVPREFFAQELKEVAE